MRVRASCWIAGVAIAACSVSVFAQTPVEAATARALRWNVDLETVLGHLSDQRLTVASALAAIRFRPVEPLTFGVVVPFSFGGGRCEAAAPFPCYPAPPEGFAGLGAISLLADWEPAFARASRLRLGLLVALPTATGTIVGFPKDGRAWVPQDGTDLGWTAHYANLTRASEDSDFFNARFVAIVPSVGLSQEVGRVQLSYLIKLRLRVGTSAEGGSPGFEFQGAGLIFDTVGAVQLMVNLTERSAPSAVSLGMRALGVFSTGQGVSIGFPHDPWFQAWSVALEPRVEAHLGRVSLRSGFVIPVAYAVYAQRAHFPAAWGWRVGVGYDF